MGNRLTSVDVSGSWTYNTNNELLGYVDVDYTYDDNGNLTEIRIAGSVVWTYVYDVANRLDPEIVFGCGFDWAFVSPYWANMVNVQFMWWTCPFPYSVCIPITFQDNWS